jgi:SAM-dependent methyltransferase
MKLARKIEKLYNGEGWENFLDAYYRWRKPLDVPQMVRDLESKGFDRIHAKYVNPDDKKGWPKYVEAERCLNLAIKQARHLHLDRRKTLRILDIGSGAGYFLHVCKQFGHDVAGMDLDIPPLYGEMFELFQMHRTVWRIEAFQPLPHLGARFDLVTAFAICFNCHTTPHVWGVKEWEFFLDDLEKNVLAPDGEIYFELNIEPWGHYTPELLAYFEKRGAWIEDRCVWFNPQQVLFKKKS